MFYLRLKLEYIKYVLAMYIIYEFPCLSEAKDGGEVTVGHYYKTAIQGW